MNKVSNWKEFHSKLSVAEPHKKVCAFAKDYLKADMRILDLGCGKGRHSLYCAGKVAEVYSVDLENSALDTLQDDIKKSGICNISATQSNIKKLPYENSFFDAIISVNVLNHGYYNDIKDFFKEIDRVLKPGGFLFAICLPKTFLKDLRTKETRELEKDTFVGLGTPDGDIPHHMFSRPEMDDFLPEYKFIKYDEFSEYSQWLKKDATHLEILAKKPDNK